LTLTDQKALSEEFEDYRVFELTRTDELPDEQLDWDALVSFLERVEGQNYEQMHIKDFQKWAGTDEFAPKSKSL
jgi:hypothetical protein